ncbi:lysophospholipid acyltransferase family protein [Oceaniglobus indicus]|uniref:lysophospholipid acyltransferase family protein n=1 Tax=Oceaniglobus indicus TaxID=2047749 RepID=UPI000C19CB46|nr:lysophospholipid acyltransferase family protein [Oceaniglobus indicus]
MSAPWQERDTPPPAAPLGVRGWIRVAARGATMAALVFGGLGVLLLVRMFERPLCGMRRPVTPAITQGVCRGALKILGLRLRRRGTPMRHAGAVVANHASWLDIFVLNALDRVYFVAKSEVAAWPGIGWLARATGTVFIRRDPREAARQREIFLDRLSAGHRLLFFPEGTSTDGTCVLPFKSTLFGAFFSDHINVPLHIQPVTVVYQAPSGLAPTFYGWWGDMDFASHLVRMLAAPHHGAVDVVFGEPRPVAAFASRKALAQDLEAAVRSEMEVIFHQRLAR